MDHPDLISALLDSLDDEALAAVAERLRPHLVTVADGNGGRFLGSREVARRLGLHERTVVRMGARVVSRARFKIGRGWRFPVDQLAPRSKGTIDTGWRPSRLVTVRRRAQRVRLTLNTYGHILAEYAEADRIDAEAEIAAARDAACSLRVP